MKKILLLAVACITLTACNSTSNKETVYDFTHADFARIDGSTVVIPLAESWAETLLDIENGADVIKFNMTPDAIKNLTDGVKDIIFTTYPSEEEIATARSKGIEFEIVPVVNDAFVFLVNDSNKVNGLSQKQIRDIYSSQITNWSEVGGENLDIMPYQRAVGSGSQSGMIRFMGDTPLQQEPTEKYIPLMGEVVETIIEPDFGKASLGYSYYYFVNAMYIREGIKLLEVDGVAPSNATIKDGTYPITTQYYAIIRNDTPANSFARKFLKFALSKQGQQLAEQAGYVALD